MTISPNNGNRWLKVREVAQLLGYNKHTIYLWVREGFIPCVRLANGQIRFKPADIEKWADEQTVGKL